LRTSVVLKPMRTPTKFAEYFDHTLLKQTATQHDVETLCQEAIENSFFSVCVNPCWLNICKTSLTNTVPKICTVIGFPLGAQSSTIKLNETEFAIEEGAQEIDCVVNVGFLKSKKHKEVLKELSQIVSLSHQGQVLVKVIVESGVLTPEELKTATQIVNDCGAEYIKTSTGFASIGATEDAIHIMKQWARPGLKIKASGGIKTAADFKKYLALGVSRVGSSSSVSILKELLEEA
jgi:deoxyribose-phosphate aldolase